MKKLQTGRPHQPAIIIALAVGLILTSVFFALSAPSAVTKKNLTAKDAETSLERSKAANLLAISMPSIAKAKAPSSATFAVKFDEAKSTAPQETGLPTNVLHRADSMFHLKQYTESMDLYTTLFNNKFYSPAMLLKMSFIEEGLGHLGQSMYYLNLYYLATHDQQALNKIEDMASHNRLEGYATSDATRLWTFLKENHLPISGALAAICVFLLAAIFYQKVRLKRRPFVTGVALIVFLGLLFAQAHLQPRPQGIIATPATYLMTGPSAGSSVLAIVGEGHRLEILGKKDVWVKVSWLNEEVYVKEDALLSVTL